MRKELDYVATEGRDKGKVFHIVEKSALQAERWARRALLAIAHAGGEQLAAVIASGGAVELVDMVTKDPRGMMMAALRILAHADDAEIEPLMAEMMTCVTICPDGSRPEFSRKLVEEDIEEVATLTTLRAEVIKLHVNFSLGDAMSTSTPASTNTASSSSNTPMSPPPSGPQFHPAKRRSPTSAAR